jgi:hypothetical protein
VEDLGERAVLGARGGAGALVRPVAVLDGREAPGDEALTDRGAGSCDGPRASASKRSPSRRGWVRKVFAVWTSAPARA